MIFKKPLVHGTLIRRYKRFLADIKLDNGKVVIAHSTNSGSMKSCIEEGAEVYLTHVDDPKRKTQFTWEMIKINDNWIGVNTSWPNLLAYEAIKNSEPLGNSPVDDTPVFETPAAYMSASTLDGDKEKGLQISKIILAREIKPDHIRQLLTDGKTELITKFISKKKRPFDAYLLLNKAGKISFEFPPRKRKEKK